MMVTTASTTRCSLVSAEAGRPPALLVFSDDWGRHPSSCQHLARYLLERYEILWVNTIGTRPPRLDLMTLARGFEKVRQWTRGTPRANQNPANLQVVCPKMWPWFRSRIDRRINRGLLVRQLTPLLESRSDRPIAVTTIPIVADLIGRLPVSRWVYYCVDDFSQWPGLDQATMRRMEERLVSQVDVIITVSETLRDKFSRMGIHAHLLTHGIDHEHWENGVGEVPVPELDGLERPLIVFWGAIDERMEVRFLERLASDLTRGTIVLVGPEQSPLSALEAIPRLVRLAPLPYEQLPGLAREAAVLIMPYADIPVTRSIQPLKLKEYLATGRPAVVSSLPSTRCWSDCLDVAATPESFSAAVRARIVSGLPGQQRTARERLAGEGWAAKARSFESWMIGRSSSFEVATNGVAHEENTCRCQ